MYKVANASGTAAGKGYKMAKVFETGKRYGAWGAGTPAIKVIKRTAKTATVEDDEPHEVWTMRIKTHSNGDEYMADSRVPQAWREAYTYDTKFEQ